MAAFCCCELGRSALLSRSALTWQCCVLHETCRVIRVFVSQVDNAATKGAAAVLIYPDTKDYNYNVNTPLYGHVSLHSNNLFNLFRAKM